MSDANISGALDCIERARSVIECCSMAALALNERYQQDAIVITLQKAVGELKDAEDCLEHVLKRKAA